MAGKASFAALIIALAGFIPCSATHNASGTKNVAELPEKEIRDLSYAIKAAPSYRADMRRSLDSLAGRFSAAGSEAEKCRLAIELAAKYRPINTDSSLYYAKRGRVLAETLGPSLYQQAQIAVIDALSTAGLFTAATRQYEKIDYSELVPERKEDYWIAGRRLYSYMRSYAQGNTEYSAHYEMHYMECDDSLVKILPANAPRRTFIESERLVTEKRFHEAQEKLEELLLRLDPESNLYGMASYQMAEVWKNLGNETEYAAWLARAALSDVKGCVTEGIALPKLADWLYQQGELGEAFAFINFALEEASSGNARMRAVTIARFVPIIDDAYNDKVKASRDELMIYFTLVTFLFILTVVLIIVLFKQIKKTKANADKLAQTSRRQESYIGNFIGLYSGYADRLNHLLKLVSTKLAAGQSAELKKLIDSGKFTDQNNEDIHKIFDAAFLDIYPEFINNVNSLLRPEEKIELKAEGTLNPELRIYAFIKLGITESTRIAQILHYSINTVYTYRNKMRNKAVNRDSFDADIMTL